MTGVTLRNTVNAIAQARTSCASEGGFNERHAMMPPLPQQLASESLAVSLPPPLRSDRIWGALVCIAVSACLLAGLRSDEVLGSHERDAHQFSASDPEWTQLVFPRLGAPTLPPTSIAGITTRLAQVLDAGREFPSLAFVAAVGQALALALFYVLVRKLGVQTAVASIATLALALHAVVFAAATAWTPYGWMPALLLMALVARRLWLESRRPTWAMVLAVAMAGAIGESLYATVLLLPLMIDVGAFEWRTRQSRFRRTIAICGGTVLVGLSFQVLGAAIAWREVSVAEPYTFLSWRDSLVAVTSRWGRVAQIYAMPTVAQAWHRMQSNWVDVGLLAAALAVVGMFAVFRNRRQDAMILAITLLVGVIVNGWLTAPVSGILPGAVVVIMLVFVFCACGLEYLGRHLRAPLWVTGFVAGVLVVHGQATPKLEALRGNTVARSWTLSTIAPDVARGWLVASNVEIDRHLEDLLERDAARRRLTRIPQTSAAIRLAHATSLPVLLWPSDRIKIAALGWLVAPHPTPDPNLQPLDEIVAEMPCALVRGAGWHDVTRLVHAGAVGLEADRSSPYTIDVESAEASEVLAEDLARGVMFDVVRGTSTGMRMVIDQPRLSLPLLRFDPVPSRVRARLTTTDDRQAVRICSAPVLGEAAWWRTGEDTAHVDLQSLRTFEDGWHGPEPIGAGGGIRRWSAKATATALVQLPGSPSSLAVELEAAPAAPESRSPTLVVEINGHRLAAQPMAPGTSPYVFPIAREHIREGLNVFRFHVPEVVSPKSLQISGDDRALGFALTGFRLRRIE